MLNNIGTGAPGTSDVRASTGSSASAASPHSAFTHDAAGYASERNVAEAILFCRARYAEISSQLDKILDIEDSRNP